MRSLEQLSATPKCATPTEYNEYFVAVPLGKDFPLSGAKFPDLSYAKDRLTQENAILIEHGMVFTKKFIVDSIFVKK